MGVGIGASGDEIRNAYRKQTLTLRLDGHRVVRSSGGGGEKVQGSRRSDYHPLGSQEKDSCDSGQDLGEEGTNLGNFDVTVF